MYDPYAGSVAMPVTSEETASRDWTIKSSIIKTGQNIMQQDEKPT
jgi:hypothetical protein